MPSSLPELENILTSGMLSQGRWTAEFENELKSFLGVEYLLTTNSFSSAIQVALACIGLEYGDEVIASPMSCLASNEPLATYGLKLRWADIDPKTGTLDPDSVRKKISQKTKLIFHNHFCGYMGYVDEINEIGTKEGIPVIDDCVEAFGSRYKGKVSGNLGTDISIFSFQTVRLPNTIDGGAIVFQSEESYRKAILLRDLGIDRKTFRDENNEISPSSDITLSGYAATLSNVNAYLGVLQMKEIGQLLEKQHENGLFWDRWFRENETEGCPLSTRKEIEPNYWVYGFITDYKVKKMLQFRENGFYASGVHINNNIYSLFGDKTELLGVREFNEKFVAIPSGWWAELK